MEYMGTKAAAEKWGYTPATISKWCRNNLIKNAEHDGEGRPWRIPIMQSAPSL